MEIEIYLLMQTQDQEEVLNTLFQEHYHVAFVSQTKILITFYNQYNSEN